MRFETHGKASEYCNRFGLKVRPVDVFDAAISLCNAYNAGRDELTAENAKLREQLAAAVELLESIGDYAYEMVKLLQEDPPATQDAIRRWGRIVDFVSKHTTE